MLQLIFSTLIELRALQRPGGVTGKDAPVPCGVVRVWEERHLASAAPGLERLLLCDQPVTSLAQVYTCARQYASCWLTEDFPQALKTGLGPKNCKRRRACLRLLPC
ncbi:MAG: hypothetical protein ACRYG7_11450 [Janthinobacterium lividum]